MNHPHHTRRPPTEGFTVGRRVRGGELVPLHATSRSGAVGLRVRHATTGVVVWTADRVAVGDHPTPDEAWRVGCDWPVASEIPTDPAWPGGVYLVDLVDDDPGAPTAHAWFALGDTPGSDRPVLLLATNTWNAYNQWGGRCMYTGGAEMSFRRPLEPGYLQRPVDSDGYDGRLAASAHDPTHQRVIDYQRRHDLPLWTSSSGWFSFERRFARWAMDVGVELDVATDLDLHSDGELLAGRSLLLVVGHSEYWSAAMRDHVDAFLAAGGNVAVFSGNTCFWQVRIEDDVMVCHKGRARFDDPIEDRSLLTSMWSDPLIGRPENRTFGLSFTRGGYHRIGEAVPRGSGGYTVHRPDHWALTGTGLRLGDQLGDGAGVVGYEVDGCEVELRDGLPVPTGADGTPTDLEIIASAPARLISITDDVCEAPEPLWASVDPPGDLEGTAWMLFGDAEPATVARLAQGRCVLASCRRGAGAVFHAGSTDWVHGLGADPLIDRITRTVVERLSR